MPPFKAQHDLAAELLKTAKIRDMEAALPIMTRWAPRAALAAGDTLAKVNGGGPNPFEKRMLGPAETILLGAPLPMGPREGASVSSLLTARQVAGQLVGEHTSGSQAICGLCGTRMSRGNRFLGDVGIMAHSHRLGNFHGDPVMRLSGLGEYGQSPWKGRWV
ncbi:hypothetical protein PG997_006488 [Apiospora hydei]|uniref:Uncharacterized protein n=1 Tax=Apiospora hydei TaxID=1337664 RepID=A0ABR1WNV4_9PEZI